MPKTRNGFYVWCGGVFLLATMAEPLGWVAGYLL